MPTKETEKKPSLKQIGLSEDTLMGLYRCLLTTRILDERLRKLFRQGRYAGTFFSAVGQEACTVGSCYGLRDEDIVGPSHREIGAAVTKGIPIKEMVAQIYARANSPDKGKTHPCHYGSRTKGVITPASTVAGQTVVATGCAMAFKIQKNDNIAIAFFGEGATARGGWHEALNYAGIHKLPIVYLCQNNLWAESVPSTLQGAIEKFSDRAKAYGFPGITIDGNGEGPTFIECMTYRWYGHSEIDPGDYRTKDEVEYWKARDPIPRHEKLLMDLGLLTTQEREAIIEDIESTIDEAIKDAESAPYAEPEEAYIDVYSPAFPVQREEY